MTNLDVILPAGGTLPTEFARVVGTSSKALITLDGKTILKTTLAVLRDSDRINREGPNRFSMQSGHTPWETSAFGRLSSVSVF